MSKTNTSDTNTTYYTLYNKNTAAMTTYKRIIIITGSAHNL
jgi:hypothetical protein